MSLQMAHYICLNVIATTSVVSHCHFVSAPTSTDLEFRSAYGTSKETFSKLITLHRNYTEKKQSVSTCTLQDWQTATDIRIVFNRLFISSTDDHSSNADDLFNYRSTVFRSYEWQKCAYTRLGFKAWLSKTETKTLMPKTKTETHNFQDQYWKSMTGMDCDSQKD